MHCDRPGITCYNFTEICIGRVKLFPSGLSKALRDPKMWFAARGEPAGSGSPVHVGEVEMLGKNQYEPLPTHSSLAMPHTGTQDHNVQVLALSAVLLGIMYLLAHLLSDWKIGTLSSHLLRYAVNQ
jgi:hypothetical protein